VILCALAVTLAGCGSSAGPGQITIGAARTFDLAGFAPAGFVAGKPTRLSFTIRQPSGEPLTKFRTGSGPHTGVHLIIVRSDLGAIVHKHPPIGPDGKIDEVVTLPTAGRYRVVVDAYPQLSGPLRNFQLFKWITATGKTATKPSLVPKRQVDVDGYRFTMRKPPPIRAIRPATLTIDVRRPDGSVPRFDPWFGALAHAIFFRAKSLDYFHTHICGAGMTGCAGSPASTQVSGQLQRDGRLRVGVLLPTAGTWRLFLQSKVDGRVMSAPFTLNVR